MINHEVEIVLSDYQKRLINITIQNMKKILLSLGMLVFVFAVVAGGTGAFFSDTETSSGNVFTAGALDLKVDSDCHYYMNGEDVGCGDLDQDGVGVGQWEESDLEEGVHKFFSFGDIKPGDAGEDTISLHVYNNDAWGLFEINYLNDDDNSCTEPEGGTEDAGTESGCDEEGELGGALLFTAWLDEGSTPGFQNVDGEGNLIDANGQEVGEPLVDEYEGNNILDEGYESPFWDEETADDGSWNIADVLSYAYDMHGCFEEYGFEEEGDGHNDYGYCHGLAEDGRMVGSTTYYFGLAWELPYETGNEVQTDSLSADMTFYVEQHRNNEDPFDYYLD